MRHKGKLNESNNGNRHERERRWKAHCGAGLKGLVRCVGGEGAGNPSDVVILGDQEIMGNLGGSTGVGKSGTLFGALQ